LGQLIDNLSAVYHGLSSVQLSPWNKNEELYKTVRSELAWRLPGSLVPDLVAYAVARLNIYRTSALTEAVAPKVAYTGIPVHYHKDVRLAFGDYVEAYEGTADTSRPRSLVCIALYLANNAAGLWQLFKIDIHTKVRRSNMVKLVTGELIIQAMNNIANEEEQSALEPVRQRLEEIAEEQQSTSMQEVVIQETDEEQLGVRQGTVVDTIKGNYPEEEEVSAESEEITAEEEATGAMTTRSGRVVNKPSRFMAVTKISRKDWKDQAVEKAIKEEIKMLFSDLKALRVVRRASIKAGTKILKSHMFVVAKHLASGEFDKMKARLVADGRDQEQELYHDKSSLTVAIHSVFKVLGMMAEKPWRVTVKIDIIGAFVQTPMKGEPTYMKLFKSLTEHVINMFPDLKSSVEADGSLHMLMLKEMYGCLQVSALWYALIKKFLEDQGYQVSETNRCVFRKK
jgi:hypothetical protein